MPIYSWETEYSKDHTPWGLIAGFSLFSAVTAVFFIFSQNFLGAALFTIMPIALILSVSYGQRNFVGMIGHTDLVLNKKKYPLQDIKSFSLVPGHLILQVREKKVVYIPINLGDEDGIRSALQDKVKEKEYQEGLFDILYRILGIH